MAGRTASPTPPTRGNVRTKGSREVARIALPIGVAKLASLLTIHSSEDQIPQTLRHFNGFLIIEEPLPSLLDTAAADVGGS